LALDAKSVALSGTLTFDGAPPTSTSVCSQMAEVYLFDPAGSFFSADIACNVKDGSFSLRAAPGTYTAVAQPTTYAAGLPTGSFTVDKALMVSGPRSGLALAVTTVPVSGTLTFDGAPPTSTSVCSQMATVTFLGNFVLDQGILGQLGLGH